MMGDSLSDRGTMYHRRLFGMIPMSKLTGLQSESPAGRFTNGLAWSDHVSAWIAEDFEIKELETKEQLRPEDIADDVIDGALETVPLVQKTFSLNDDRMITYKGEAFVRNYDEGGLTAYDYSWQPSKSISRFFARLILSTLSAMRKKLLAYDDAHELSQEHKDETLVVEWSGANDLITANERPSAVEVDHAIIARIENVKQLMKAGYRHFVLFNLPNLALTPRYQAKSEAERTNAQVCSARFNAELAKACLDLSANYPHCSIELFDVNHVFEEIYQYPEAHGFEKEKLKEPFIKSRDFEIEKNGTSPAKGYMFWDDVHPTADMHALLAQRFYTKYKLEYQFTAPTVDAVHQKELHVSEEELLHSFRKVYGEMLTRDRNGFFGGFRHSNIHYATANLDEILTHALYNGGNRSLAVMKELQWFDEKGNLNLNIPVLKAAVARVREARSEGVSVVPSQ